MAFSRSRALALLRKRSRDKLLLAALLYQHVQENNAPKIKHRFWVSELIIMRESFGAYYHLVQEIQFNDEQFKKYFRLSRQQFEEVLKSIERDLQKLILTRTAITPKEILALTLR